ncbi:hypothetical protein [Candidatus Nitrosopumilus sediminis]|uniref:hypothetical protein n=1 Tax=Candidatus Nitrosopumilus sediminis TaxID=1229909 RepID=UPI000369B7DE|nr:hypothetical protein [Candidatus Nitrosopumilus sediminis]
MKTFKIRKETVRKISIPLLLKIGRTLEDEIKNMAKNEFEHYPYVRFEFDDNYESHSDSKIDEVLKGRILKENTKINFHLYDEKRGFSIYLEYGTVLTNMLKIMIPKGQITLMSDGGDQIWCEGISNKFLRLIETFDDESFDATMIKSDDKEKSFQTNQTKQKSLPNQEPKVVHPTSIVKTHLTSIVIGTVASIIGGIIVYFVITNLDKFNGS